MRGKALQEQIYNIILSNWPVNITETVSHLGLDSEDLSKLTKISYHFRMLEKQEMIRTKRIGRAVVAWPMEIEKLRVIHELLKV